MSAMSCSMSLGSNTELFELLNGFLLYFFGGGGDNGNTALLHNKMNLFLVKL